MFQFGDGTNRITPIDVTDLAAVIGGLLRESRHVATVGGPETMTWDDLAQQCFRAAGRRERIIHIPKWILSAILFVARPISHSRYGVLSFVGHVQTGDTSAPEVGDRRLDEFLANHIANETT